ncbi:hypothetical protein ACRAWF_16720 [Streptomyces sp. L7]
MGAFQVDRPGHLLRADAPGQFVGPRVRSVGGHGRVTGRRVPVPAVGQPYLRSPVQGIGYQDPEREPARPAEHDRGDDPQDQRDQGPDRIRRPRRAGQSRRRTADRRTQERVQAQACDEGAGAGPVGVVPPPVPVCERVFVAQEGSPDDETSVQGGTDQPPHRI